MLIFCGQYVAQAHTIQKSPFFVQKIILQKWVIIGLNVKLMWVKNVKTKIGQNVRLT